MSEVRSKANAREARLLLGAEFQDAIEDFGACTQYLGILNSILKKTALPFDAISLRILSFLFPSSLAKGALATWLQEETDGSASCVGPMRLFVRVRPLMPTESQCGDYVSTTSDSKGIVVHDGRIAKDGRSLFMVHRRFNLGSPFHANCTTSTVYDSAVRPLVAEAAKSATDATILLWGQTGTGKTHTTAGLLKCLADDIFSLYSSAAGATEGVVESSVGSSGAFSLQVRVFEMAGTKRGMLNQLDLFDLLADRKKVYLRVDENDEPHVRGCASVLCADADSFHSTLERAFKERTSTSVERNEASSRSHMFVEVVLPGGLGIIRFGDLAGSERNYEVQYHSRARHVEGGDINASLMALKDCIRLRRQQLVNLDSKKNLRVPYRDSKLTLYLKSCFNTTPCALIATASPASTDVDHTINTLVHMTTMRGTSPGMNRSASGVPKSVFKAKSTTVQSATSRTNMEEWNVLNRWDHVQADEDIWQLEGADGEALVWLRRHRQDNEHDVSKWSAEQVQTWIAAQQLQEANIPHAMTGAQLMRLGCRRLEALGGENGLALFTALKSEIAKSHGRAAEVRQETRRIYDLALGPERADIERAEISGKSCDA